MIIGDFAGDHEVQEAVKLPVKDTGVGREVGLRGLL